MPLTPLENTADDQEKSNPHQTNITANSLTNVFTFFGPEETTKKPFSLLGEFINDVYNGKFGVNAEIILKHFHSHPSFPEVALAERDYSNADFLQLEFLSICLRTVYLQNKCHDGHCKEIHLPEKHTVIDHLKQLFFLWAECKYTPIGLPALNASPHYEQSEHEKLSPILKFLFENFKEEIRDNNPALISIRSMLATIVPFITSHGGSLVYDIGGFDIHFYKWINEIKEKPCYVRLGGILRRPHLVMNLQHVDMRGVDLHHTRFWGDQYYYISHSFTVPARQELLKYHADFSGADLRGANLRRTEFRLLEAIAGTQFDRDTQFRGSNIEALRREEATIIPNDNLPTICTIL